MALCSRNSRNSLIGVLIVLNKPHYDDSRLEMPTQRTLISSKPSILEQFCLTVLYEDNVEKETQHRTRYAVIVCLMFIHLVNQSKIGDHDVVGGDI